ncbi:hypothetical protein HPB51_013194 [Rhipicephalus microplus]|uniref:Uncharacterized protein n=1 Tax=Rhipicephalus microplus TaxID=6941 RepID=A0A9J6EGW5_RHIMP|nr:hypothetical protein HPB51_013194 [Rhipicephalus microplus]
MPEGKKLSAGCSYRFTPLSMDLAENLASCTYNQGGTCAIFGQLNDINGLLRQVKLELRETSPGTLSLTQAPHLRLSQDFMSGQNPEAWHLLDAVLQQHLCVISICIDERQELTGIPFDIITRKKSLTIRTLQLSLCLCYRGDYMGHCTQLAACLGINCKLRTLILERCCFDCVPGLQVILDALRYARQLVTLYLIGFNNTKVFAESLDLGGIFGLQDGPKLVGQLVAGECCFPAAPKLT